LTVERYVTAAELAQLMGVSVRTIKRMTAAGMPSETWGMSRTRRYLPSQAMGWASQRARITPDNHRPRRLTSAAGQQREE
jgi:phage terminase Nu1 subunit (DNA packaging protein)